MPLSVWKNPHRVPKPQVLIFFRCKIPGLDNDTYKVQSSSHEKLIRQFIPIADGDTYDCCKIYTGDDIIYDNLSRPVNASEVSCSEWVYDETVFTDTFTKKVKKQIQKTFRDYK